ncbi:discoidin domain-containing protein [Pedobacter frigiditerrae]|uniref:discoidin domain-containing protein n=1 Tax=Pedobacter frigiditerrae TaxID=2530452 RepID=UPI0029316964|nr:discoidin domain-containing protein [Pedobacter frigiditerrae]
MTFLKIAKGAVGLCASIVLLTGCLKEDYPSTELFTWKAKVDVTDKAALTVNFEYSGGASGAEGSTKLIDNNYTTKYLINPYQSTMYMQLAFPQAQQVASYTLTSGDDAPGRDPKNWKLSGSTDGTTWVDLDTKTGEVFSGRRLTRTFSFKNLVAYKFYRLSITANAGDSLFQLTEWRLIEVPAELQ